MSTTSRSAAEQPSFLEIGEGVLFGIDCLVVGGTVAPGLLFCVPAILFALTPFIVLGLLLVLVALVMAAVAAPVVLTVRAVRWLRTRERGELVAAPAPAPALRHERAPAGLRHA